MKKHCKTPDDSFPPINPLSASIRRVLAAGLSLGLSNAEAGELPVPKAAFATLGRADQSVMGNKMTINQHTNQAILNWEKFNIGKDSTVEFKQPGANAVALNRIYQSDPSRILGNLTANGQVFLLNQNGFMFGRDSKVNVNSLVVSSLNMSDDTFERGFTKVFNQDGRAALEGSGEVYQKGADGQYLLNEKGEKIKTRIEFEAGSRVNVAQSGRLIVAAPSIVNEGTLRAPKGQILAVAATDKVYLQETSNDSSLRGLVVEVATGGDVTNVGNMISASGNTTLMGFAVNQKGRISATTSVSANGSIRLLAREGATGRREGDKWLLQPSRTQRGQDLGDGLGTRAQVALGRGSLTEATPDLANKSEAVDGQTQETSRVEVMGKDIVMESGAVVRAQSGQVTMNATENPVSPNQPDIKNDSKLNIASGAVIDVSGVKNVPVPVSRNIVEVELRSNELRDAPLQKNGVLYGQKIKVDIRKGTPIADISGALERIARTVGERSTGGGTVNLGSEGSASVAQGSRIDISGGSVLYTPDLVNTTQLIGPDGRSVVDISNADPNVRYLGIVSPIIRTFANTNLSITNPLVGPVATMEAGYVEGKSAGSLNIKTALLNLKGEMLAAAVNGRNQRTADLQALGGTLSIDLARTQTGTQSVVFGKKNRDNDLELDGESLAKAGLQKVQIKTHAAIDVASGNQVRLVNGGQLALEAGEINVAGQITARSGQVDLQTNLVGGEAVQSGVINLAQGSVIDTSGVWTNDRPARSNRMDTLDFSTIHKAGGTVNIRAEGDVNLRSGSLIDVSGGARRRVNGIVNAGDAGTISMVAAGIDGSDLSLQGALAGYAIAGGKGGTLALTSDQVRLGSASGSTSSGDARPLILNPGFFTQGGFEHYQIGSNKSGIEVADNSRIQLTVQNRVFDESASGRKSGENLSTFTRIETLPELRRPAGQLDLILSQDAGFGGKDAGIRIGAGAEVATIPGGKLALTSDGSIFVNGRLTAKSGEIAMTIAPPSVTDLGFLPNQGIWLGSSARLDVSGASRTYQNRNLNTVGEVLNGGKITLHADRGFIGTSQGSVMNVAGTADYLTIPKARQNLSPANGEDQLVASNGGRIELRSAEGMNIQGSMEAKGGGAGAQGGTLQVEMNPYTRKEPGQIVPGQLPFPAVPNVISISANGSGGPLVKQGEDIAEENYGRSYLAANKIGQGGFSELNFKTPDRIEFNSAVDLRANRSVTLDASTISWNPTGSAAGKVTVNAPYVALGSSQTRPGGRLPSSGEGVLSVTGGLIDLVGSSATSGFGNIAVQSQGDIRLVGVRTQQQQRDFLGEFLTSGNMTLSANQLYPTTLSDFKIAIQGNEAGQLNIKQLGAPSKAPLLSAGGKLTLEAPNITQSGTIRAPLGEITLKASDTLQLTNGSITSNSAAGSLIPFGKVQGGLDWIFPMGQQNLVYERPPEKRLTLKGDKVTVAAGARVDSRGGGDLIAYEFIPGLGGSYDVLDPSSQGYKGSFAVMPAYQGKAAPVDPLELPGSGLTVGDSIYLSGGGGLAAGNYVLLPAHYALLPGAFLITPRSGSTDFLPGRSLSTANGGSVVAGYRTVANTDLRDPRWSGFVIEPGTFVRQRSEFAQYTANEFFANKARENGTPLANLPRHGGTLAVAAKTDLKLDGEIVASNESGGQGGRLDITADNIAIVGQLGSTLADGVVALSARKLNSLNMASLFVGGIRTEGDAGTRFDVQSRDIRLQDGASLKGREVILAARNEVALDNGTSLASDGSSASKNQKKPIYEVNGDAAFVRVSSASQASLQRTNVRGSIGSIQLAEGASIISNAGAMMLDASAENTLAGSLVTSGGSVALGAKRISLGELSDGASGLQLEQRQLAAIQADELILNSGSDISLFGNVELKAKNLTLQSGGLFGFANADKTARLSADNLFIANGSNAYTNRQGYGTGDLDIQTQKLTLGQGEYQLGGFNNARFDISKSLTGEEDGTLTARTNLAIKTPRITGERGANTRIDATGYSVDIQANGNATDSTVDALGARLAITADGIRQGSQMVFPSGSVKLSALNGDLTLSQGAEIDVSGRLATLGKRSIETAGGAIQLLAENGNITVDNGSTLKLGGAEGGSLELTVPKGQISLAGDMNAKGTQTGGRFILDAGDTNSVGTLGGLGARLKTAGFTDQISLRGRSGDWSLNNGESIEARHVALTADQGAIQLAGQITAQGKDAQLRLNAADALRFASSSRLTVQGTTTQGGLLVASAVDTDGDGQGGITLENGAQVDVSNTAGGVAGEVRFRTDRSGQDVAFSGDMRTAVKGSTNTTLEAVKIHEKNGVISEQDIASWKSETDSFMANADAIEGRLGLPGGLLAGLDIRSKGDLTIDSAGWNLVDWRYGERAGELSLTALGNINIRGKLSDGFKDDANGIDLSAVSGSSVAIKDKLQSGRSWGFHLDAGKNVTVGANSFIRTGTGNIDITAGEDLVLTNASSAIYTAGRADAARYGSFNQGFVANNFFGEYPVDGGDINIKAGQDVIGARTGQLFDGWMSRTGNWTQNVDHSGETPTAWAIAIGGPEGSTRPSGSFNQNIGALGGGNIVVNAGRDVSDLSAIIATTGKQVGELTNPNDPTNNNFNTNVVQVLGGGDLLVKAGGDVLGGTFYTGRGIANISAAGSIKASETGDNLGPVLALGDSQFNLRAGDDIELAAAINPTVINDARSRNYFFTYTGDSRVSLQALAGNVTLANQTVELIDSLNALRPFNNQLRFPGVSQEALSVYPAGFQAVALQGDVIFGNSFVTYPGARSEFTVLAGGNITTRQTGNNVNVTLSDADASLLPGISNPATSWEDANQRLQPFGSSNLIHAKTPVHKGDPEPALIYAKGDIRSNDALLFSLSKAANVEAGRDIKDVSFQLQHTDYALSSMSAGRDIQFTTPRNQQGNLVNLTREIRVAGPGELWLTAGRTIDLGASAGAYTIGNTNNSALAERGASISVQAGVANGANWAGFAQKYKPTSGPYADLLRVYMSERTGKNLSAAAAASAYNELPEEQRNEFLLKVLFQEIQISATLAAKSGNTSDYGRGYAAIDALYPGAGNSNAYKGDLKLFFSRIHTVDGGDINMMVPGGLVNAGLAVAFAGAKPASELGIVTQREGSINGFVEGNFLVNQSRVFALDGGNITLWSSNGNIDAGRGSKAAIAVPPPIISFDEQGNLKVEVPPAVSGSGIRTAASTVVQPGDVTLAAPRGVVDAGEAGIGGSNITIAATAVLGASNIDVGGSSTGVPSTSVSVPVASPGAASAAASASNQATQTAESAVNNDTNQAMEKNALAENASSFTPLQVDILGFGECAVVDIKEGKPGCV